MTRPESPWLNRHVSKPVTKVKKAALYRALKRSWGVPVTRPRTVRCRRCQKTIHVKPRGREPVYCSRHCRQRTYEARKAAEHRPVGLLMAGLARHELHAMVRSEVQKYLRAYLGKRDAMQQLEKLLEQHGLDDDSLA